jgi:hypothetical protein
MARTRLLLLLWILMIIIAVLLACRPGATAPSAPALFPTTSPTFGVSCPCQPDTCAAPAGQDIYGANSTSRSST